ncbi:MAG: hypothetical protein AUK63_1629 [bacterium P3]|nr:MAG: hypothetical protein AUK63_1629 [bacterium P3]KWW39007.1 MAG: hypothetical protein F083_1967 [bacterium F083]
MTTEHTLHDCPSMMEYIEQTGLLPLLDSGVPGFSADAAVAPECRYRRLDDGGWEWPLWKWKGPLVTEGHFAYGKFFDGKAGFVSMQWWPDLCNWRRSRHPVPDEDSLEGAILAVLQTSGSMISRELRAACGFTGPRMRSRFDACITRLQMACRVVTEDFVYPRDRHDRPYGWGWSLLATPERLYGRGACRCERSPEESCARLHTHLRALLPDAGERQIARLVG